MVDREVLSERGFPNEEVSRLVGDMDKEEERLAEVEQAMAYSHKVAIARSKKKMKYRISMFEKQGDLSSAKKVRYRLERLEKNGQ